MDLFTISEKNLDQKFSKRSKKNEKLEKHIFQKKKRRYVVSFPSTDKVTRLDITALGKWRNRQKT